MDPTYPLAPVANLIAVLLVALPLSGARLRPQNIGVLTYALWVLIDALTIGIDSLIWSNNVRDVAPVWCDIVSHLGPVINTAVPACSLVITRRLSITIRQNRDGVESSASNRRNVILFDLSICLGLPIVMMGIYYTVQSNRYTIIEEIGCHDAVSQAGLSELVLDLGQIVFPLISIFCYSPRILCLFYHQRKANNGLNMNHGEGRVSRNNYRLLAIGCLDAFIMLPLGIIGVVNATSADDVFWPGWSTVHKDWSHVPTIPAYEWRSDFWEAWAIEWSKWINVLLAIIFFLLFGLTKEALNHYRSTLSAVLVRVGIEQSVRNRRSTEIVFGSASMETNVNPDVDAETRTSNLSDTNGSRQPNPTFSKVEMNVDLERGITFLEPPMLRQPHE